MASCTSCNKEVPVDGKFCPYCREPLGAENCAKRKLDWCPHCKEDVPVDSEFCPYCGESLDSESLSAKEIASIQVKLSSYRHKQAAWGVSSLIGVFCIVSSQINPNTGLLVAGIAYTAFSFIMVMMNEIRHESLRRKLEE